MRELIRSGNWMVLFVVLAALLAPQAAADGGLNVSGYTAQGKAVIVSVTNTTGQTLDGTITVTLTQHGIYCVQQASIRVQANQTKDKTVDVQTITDDIDPLDDHLTVGVSVNP
jgi:hypothetical protein